MPKNRCKIHIISSFIIFAIGMCLLKGTEKAFRNRESIQKEI